MKSVIVNVADIIAQPGAPLSAEYWSGKRDGETYEQWHRRTCAEAQLRLAQRHLDRAVTALKRAGDLLRKDQS